MRIRTANKRRRRSSRAPMTILRPLKIAIEKDLVPLRAFTIAEIYRIFGVPLRFIGQ